MIASQARLLRNVSIIQTDGVSFISCSYFRCYILRTIKISLLINHSRFLGVDSLVQRHYEQPRVPSPALVFSSPYH